MLDKLVFSNKIPTPLWEQLFSIFFFSLIIKYDIFNN